MTDKTCWESFKVEGENVAEKIKQLIHEGNVRRVVVKQQGRTIAEFPLTAPPSARCWHCSRTARFTSSRMRARHRRNRKPPARPDSRVCDESI
jgi:hypothetical protein